MKREILFRGKWKDNGEWVEGFLFEEKPPLQCFGSTEKSKYYILNSGFADWNMPRPTTGIEVIPETIGQFTGLTDKNGVKIFEGDILRRGEGISFVVWCLDSWRFNSWMPGSMDLYNSVDKTRGENYEVAEVVGNIYDNPELL